MYNGSPGHVGGGGGGDRKPNLCLLSQRVTVVSVCDGRLQTCGLPKLVSESEL